MKILALDLETYPHLAYTWSTFKTTIGHNQIVEPARVACMSYKWIGDKGSAKITSEWEHGREDMLLNIWELLDEADVLLGYNNAGFDNKWLNSEFITEGFQPPSPSRSIDLYQVIKSNTMYPSKKLAYVAPTLVADTKVTHTGFELWVKCMAGDPEALALMESYALQDTDLLEPLYYKLRPWIKNHPVTPLYSDDEVGCPTCGSDNIQWRGYYYTTASKFRRYRCNDCGKWSRIATRESTTALRNV